MGDISKQKLVMTKSLRIFGGSCSAHTSPEIPTKQNIKVTASINIWGPFYVTKYEGLGGG